MRDAGMAVRLDPLGSLIGRYDGDRPDAKTLLIGSHIDSVRQAGAYDGALGVMIGIECVEALYRSGRRLPFAIEVIAFGDEEGSRFASSMHCSRGLVQPVDPAELEEADSAGVTLAQALAAFGLDPSRVADAQRPAAEILAFVEAHIEQGPVLESEGLPVGVVSGIAAQTRLKARFAGQAGHAGTSPMSLRRDAIAGAAEAVLAVEAICGQGPFDLRGTVGRFEPASAAYNVITGAAEIGLDVRAATEATRDAALDRIRLQFRSIADRRGLSLHMQVVQALPASPCDPALMQLMSQAVQARGVRPLEVLSGAGHDSMVLAQMAPMAMLFIRCEGGISHNPKEQVAIGDVDVAIGVLIDFIERLALEAK
jgi:allantoate deiminase